MAKQTGIHLLRGKVGEMSYYKQSGVAANLVRSINPAMSGRVKTAPEYANTRLNNREFKTATRMASSMIQGVVPRFRPMFNTFKNGRLSKDLLQLLKTTQVGWGQRAITYAQRASAAKAINFLAKNNFDDFVSLSAIKSENGIDVSFSLTDTLKSYLQTINADSVSIQISNVYIYEGIPTDSEEGRADNLVRFQDVIVNNFAFNEIPVSGNAILADNGVDLSLATGRTALNFIYVVLMPKRDVNGVDHILQEGCTFKVIESPVDLQ